MTEIYEDHAAAVLGLLTGNTHLTVFDGKIPDPTPAPPYVQVYLRFDSPLGAPGNALDGVSAEVTTSIYCHCVGRTAAAARIVASQVRTSLLDVTPTISGRTCGQIVSDPGTNVAQPDETTGVSVMDLRDDYHFVSHPA